jgi:CheY-like chemotaxis protein
VAIVEPLVEKNHNRLEVTVAPDLGSMRADVTKVRQSLLNLLSNAAKFTSDGRVELDVRRVGVGGGDWITFRVTDTGIGLTKEQSEKLFQSFAQADASTTRKYGGTGLGLAISRKFCRMMGGDIAVASELGTGSTFMIRLPVTGGEAQAETDTGDPAHTARIPTVLVIDDDPAARDMLGRALTREGYRVVSAPDGEEGLQLARSVRPDVITLDVMMPNMDGFAVLSALKGDSSLSEIPVVMVSMVEDKSLAYALGVDEYLCKPVDRDQLVTIVNRLRRDGDAGLALVVDDDDATRASLRHALAAMGWQVAEAENGRVALDRMRESAPALILLDLVMPEMDGFEFVEALRENEVWRLIPVVVVTAKDITDEDRARLNGSVQRVIPKRTHAAEDIAAEVRNLLSQLGERENAVGS